MLEIGRICVKVAGKESGKTCVIVDKVDAKNVLIDGNVKRKHCNINHLEPTPAVLKIKKGASTADVHKALKEENYEILEKKGPKEKKSEKPVKQRKGKAPSEKPAKEEKKATPKKKAAKKAAKKK